MTVSTDMFFLDLGYISEARMVSLFKARPFTWREGYLNTRTLQDMPRVYKADRVTLALGLPYLSAPEC